MTDLLSELEAVVGLAEKATPGPWHRHTDCPGKCCWHVFTAKDGIYGPETDNAGDSSLINSPEMAEEDAAYIVALSNFLRAHHAEIAAAVRDAGTLRRVKAMRDEWERDEREHMATFGQHLPASVICMVEKLDTAMRAGEGEG